MKETTTTAEVLEKLEKKRSQNVTAKTLKAWMEQTRRIIKEGLIKDKANVLKITEIAEDVKKEWLNRNF